MPRGFKIQKLCLRMLLTALLMCQMCVSYDNLVQAQEVTGGGAAGGADTVLGPRFVVKAVSFEALDETSWDWAGSDEVLFTVRTPQYTLIGKRYVDIDSDGDVHAFEQEVNCIAPAIDNDGRYNLAWQCSSEGMAAPFSFVVGAYEQDSDRLQAIIDLFSGAGGFGEEQNTERSDLHNPNDNILREEFYPNVLIGKEDIRYSLAELLDKLPQVGQSFTAKMILVGGCDGSTTTSPCRGNEPLYEMTYQITRVSDRASLPVDPNP
jgi:hypothetical protein